jgi:hypothetical protein
VPWSLRYYFIKKARGYKKKIKIYWFLQHSEAF